MNYKVSSVYFSATGNSKKSACAIAKNLDDNFEEIDVTMQGSTIQKTFSKENIVVIAAPVYGGRVYKGAMERFASLKGNQTPCVVIVTYGNRHYDDALLELTTYMKERGFLPVAAAALVGEHTYGAVQVGRPDEADIKADIDFSNQIKEILKNQNEIGELAVPGNYPYKDGGMGGAFRPQTDDKCISCRLCVRECPENAIADDCRTIDNEKCIACFRCIRICPVKAKNMDDVEVYQNFAKDFTKKLSIPRENEYFLA